MVGDDRALTKLTVPGRYPIPYLLDLTYNLHGCLIFSKVDLLRAFHEVPVKECDISKTAICTPFGSYEYLWMPFGLLNAAQTQQRLMDEVLRYLEDIQIASKTIEEHQQQLEAVFNRIKDYGRVVNSNHSMAVTS